MYFIHNRGGGDVLHICYMQEGFVLSILQKLGIVVMCGVFVVVVSLGGRGGVCMDGCVCMLVCRA